MKKYWIFYIIGILLLFHPHLAQKLNMLWDYFTHPDYKFWTTFSMMDFLDLILHAGLPLLIIAFGIRQQFFSNK
jgi:hypothetical protein